MKRKIPLSQCRVVFLMILLFITSVNGFAQNLYVGESEFLETPDIAYDGWVTHAWWSCENPNIEFSEADEYGAIVKPIHYFEGTATVECMYAYTYYGWDDRKHVGSGTTYFYIRCNPNYASISDTDIELNIGETHRLSYSLDDYSSIKGEWSSSNEDVATVDSKGNVKAISSGKARIVLDPIVGPLVYCNVEVAKIDPTGVSIKDREVSVVEGKSKTLNYELKPKGASSDVEWTSSDENVVKVSSTGKITGVSEGSATITITTENGHSASCKVKVISAPKSVSLPEEKNVIQGYTVQLIPELTPIESETTYKWKSDDTSIATVSSDGMVMGKSVGTASITVTTDNGLTASCSIVVTDAPKGADSQNVKTRMNIIGDLIDETLEFIKNKQ